jgi:hypothetical protein
MTMHNRVIQFVLSGFIAAMTIAAIAEAQPGLSFNKDATLTGTGTVASPIRVNTTTLAGTGLAASGTALAVGCGTGLTCAADSISISSAVATTTGCSTDAIPVHDSTSGLGCSAWTDDGTDTAYTGAGTVFFDTLSSGLLDNLYITTGNGVGNKSIHLDSNTVIWGDTSNEPSLNRRAALELFSGRDSSHALNSGQTNGDIAIQSGAASGGFRHWISSEHDATAANNALRFWVNSGATAEDSSAPGTGNVNVLDMYGNAAVRLYGALAIDGNATVGNASGDSHTINGEIGINATVAASGQDVYIKPANGGTNLDLRLESGDGKTLTVGVVGGSTPAAIGATNGFSFTGAATFNNGLTSTAAASTFGDLRGTAQTVATCGHDIALNATTTILICNGGGVYGITGGAAGRILHVVAGTIIDMAHEAGGSTAANRLQLTNSTSGYMYTYEIKTLIYDGTASRWRVTQHVRFPFVSSDSTLSSSGNATLGDAATDSHTANGDLAVTDDLTVTDVTTLTGNLVANGAANTYGDANTDTHTFNGHVHATGTDPTLSTCGTSPTIIGNDTAGTVTVGTGGTATACTITFANAFPTNAPSCVFTSQMGATVLNITAASTTAITVTNGDPGVPVAFPPSGKFNYHCIGVP